MFKQVLLDTIRLFVDKQEVIDRIWKDIITHYTAKARHYHNLDHLEHIAGELMPLQPAFKDWNAVVLATAYHDIIYDPLKHNNEEKSATYAEKQLQGLVRSQTLELCTELIMATKTHMKSPLGDINYFTDADLSILGADEETYNQYTKQIRTEYHPYPDLIYKPGRRKVLKHFLEMDQIFKTDHFFEKYEQAARKNLQIEYSRIL
jgi:predicted metal-dependent HD superfamily phosphohydrolase